MLLLKNAQMWDLGVLAAEIVETLLFYGCPEVAAGLLAEVSIG